MNRLMVGLVFAGWTLTSHIALATSIAAAPELQHEVLRTWTTRDGLPQNFITAIQQTPDGFLWVGTLGGLARFDGLRFRTYDHDEPAALRGRITDLAVDGRGTLWIGTPAGLFRQTDGTFEAVTRSASHVQTAGPDGVQKIQRANDGDGVWVLSKTGLGRVTAAATRLPPLPIDPKSIADFTEDGAGKLWVADRAGAIATIEEGGLRTRQHLAAELLYTAPDGEVYAGDGHRLYRLEGGQFVQQPKRGPNEFVRLLVDRGQRLWMASGGLQGITRFAEGRLESLDARHGLASDDARILFEDRDGDVWIGTISGLQRLHPSPFRAYSERDGLVAGAQYDSIFEDRTGAIWAGTLASGIARFNGRTWQHFGLPEGLRTGQVRGFAEADRAPVVAIADYGVFARFRTYRKLPNLPAGYVSSPVRTADGSLWFSVLHKGICRLQRGTLTVFGPEQGVTDESVGALVPGSQGDLWAGGKTGAFHWKEQQWSRVPGLAGAVHSILLVQGGTLFGTSDGIVYQGAHTTRSLKQQNGLPSAVILALQQDARGDVWAATTRGICRIPYAQMQAVIHGTSERVTPELFTQDDGLPGGQGDVLPIAQVLATRAHDGRLWFATAAGPVVAEPGQAAIPSPRAVLDELTVDNRRLPLQSTTVAPGRHRLLFSFTAPSFVAPEQTRFRYRLLGWDTAWMDAGSLREADYIGLPPGTYTFQVQAIGRTGEPGAITQGVSLRLRPFVWQTRWFYLFVLALVAAVVAAITRQRTLAHAERLNLRFQERSAERERIAAQIHDTFVQDLTGTALQLELVGLQYEEDPLLAQQSLRHLTVRLREMIARSRDIVSNLHAMAGPGESLLDLLRGMESELRLFALPRYHLRSQGAAQPLHPFLRDELYRICREAVANAFRHAQAQQVSVLLRFEEQKLAVQVCDDGSGMPETVRMHGRAGHFGLSGMQVRADRIGATLHVASTEGVGTCISLEVSIKAASALAGLLPGGPQGRLHRRLQRTVTKERNRAHEIV